MKPIIGEHLERLADVFPPFMNGGSVEAIARVRAAVGSSDFPPFMNGGSVEAHCKRRFRLALPTLFPPFMNGGSVEARSCGLSTASSAAFRRS